MACRRLRCFQFSIGHAFAQAPSPRQQRNPREPLCPPLATGRPQRLPRAQPSRPKVAYGVPDACFRNPRAAELSAPLSQPRPTDAPLGLLAITLPETPRALQRLKFHAPRRRPSQNHNLNLPQRRHPAPSDPGATRPRLANPSVFQPNAPNDGVSGTAAPSNHHGGQGIFARPAPTARPRRSRVRCTLGWAQKERLLTSQKG